VSQVAVTAENEGRSAGVRPARDFTPSAAALADELADDPARELAGAPTIRPDDPAVDIPTIPTPMSTPMSMSMSTSGRLSGAPGELAPPRAPARPVRVERPAAWYALAAASTVMGLFSVVLFAVGALAFPSAPPPLDFGVVIAQAAPPGTTMTVDGVTTTVPGQIAVPLDGAERVVDVTWPDGRKQQHTVVFAPGSNAVALTLQAP
jgi:hypothetical protein